MYNLTSWNAETARSAGSDLHQATEYYCLSEEASLGTKLKFLFSSCKCRNSHNCLLHANTRTETSNPGDTAWRQRILRCFCPRNLVLKPE